MLDKRFPTVDIVCIIKTLRSEFMTLKMTRTLEKSIKEQDHVEKKMYHTFSLPSAKILFHGK